MKLVALTIVLVLSPALLVDLIYAQNSQRPFEMITVPFSAANAEFSSPQRFDFASTHSGDWIITIQNNLLYKEDNPEAKVVIRFKENVESEDSKFVEVAMFPSPSYKVWVAVANEGIGYMRLYENTDSWTPDRAVTASLVQSERLSINNGQRTMVDRLRIGSFILDGVEVYGRDDIDAPPSAVGGKIVVEVLSGNPLDNPITMIPAVLAIVTAGFIVTLLMIKKRA